MLTPDEVEGVAAGIVSGHEETLVSDMLRQLVSALAKDGDLTVKELRLLETAAANNRNALARILVEYQPKIRKQTVKIVTDALKASDDGDVEVLSRLYALPVTAGKTALFARLGQESADGLAKIITRQNIQMAAHAEQLWYDVSAEAITAYNHGVVPMDRIISRAVTRLSREGVSTIDYKSGVRNNVDVAVRRHVVSQVGQAAGRMTMSRLEQYGHDLVWVSAHFGARPEHAEWQGKAYSLTGSGGYEDFYEATGYGDVAGLLGVNCRHSFGPYFDGITELPELPDEMNGMDSETYYDATQDQRAMERAVRAYKREVAALETAGADATDARLKLGKAQGRLRTHVSDKGLVRQPKREKAYGLSEQPRALRTAR